MTRNKRFTPITTNRYLSIANMADDTIYQVLEVTQEAEGVVSFWSVSIVTGIGQYLYFPRYTDITACLHIYAK
jgi:hypothetical protein